MSQKTRKLNINDHKSNLNTSCASDSHSSMMSSAYQFNIDQSLTKIAQLKNLYYQTCEEEQQLKCQNQNLSKILQNLKVELEILIQNKFENEKIYRNDQKNTRTIQTSQKIYKPGSIAKLNKKNDCNDFSQPKFQNKMQPFKFSSLIPKFQKIKNQNQIIPNLKPFQTRQKYSHKKATSNLTIENPPLPKHSYRKSVDFKSQKQQNKANQIRKIDKFTINIDQNFQSESGIRKSYLNSPRTSIIGTPRTKLR